MYKTFTAALVACTFAMPAYAQGVCGEREKFIDHLSSSYSEAPVAVGLASSGNVIEVLASNDGSWTIIITRPNGTSCVVASGEAWQEVTKVALGPNA